LVVSAIIANAIRVSHAMRSIAGLERHLNDDLHRVTLSKDLLASPPIELWPKVIRRLAVPEDLEELLLTKLERDR